MSEPDDLLHDAVFGLRVGASTTRASLPELLALLAGPTPVEPTALQPHQHHAWHAFLVQVAALARHHAGLDGFLTDAATWRAALLGLAGGVGEAWRLVVADLSKPAFQQPPAPEGALDRKRWSPLVTPDELDVLVTAKNHDVKQSRIRHPRVEHWVYALVSLQTMQGFLGAGNYGIARMNGGFGNRPALAATADARWNERFVRDVSVWLRQREHLVEDHGYRDRDGLGLVWLAPWDGLTAIPSTTLDPFFVETCRRVRFTREASGPCAWMLPTKTARLAFSAGGGDTGDIWTPIDRERQVALSLAGTGFHYSKLVDLLFSGDWVKPPALDVGDAKVSQLHAWALVRGQGKTEGLHERTLPLGPKVRQLLLAARTKPEAAELLAKRATERVKLADTVRLKVLRHALCMLAQDVPDKKVDLTDKRIDGLVSGFDADVDAVFFPELFKTLEEGAEDDRAWKDLLLRYARRHFERATGSLPFPSSRRWRAIARGQGVLEGTARKHLPDLFSSNPPPDEGDADVEQPAT